MHMGLVSLDSPDCSCVKFANTSSAAGTIPTGPDGSNQVSPLSPFAIHTQDDSTPTRSDTSFGLDRTIDHNAKTPIYTLHSSFLC